MRIAVDLTPIHSDGSAGGVTGVAIVLLKALMKENNIKLILLCAEHNKKYLSEIFGNNVDYKIVAAEHKNIRKKFWKKILCKLDLEHKKIEVKYNADLLFCPFSAVNYKVEGIPAVSTINDIQHEFYPQFFSSVELQHRRNFYKNIVENAERIICISDYTKKTFCECYGYNSKHATTVYIAIQERFCTEDSNILDKLGLKRNNYIVFPANFWEHKNHKLLLNAFGMYAVRNPEGKLVLTGNTLEQGNYYNQIIKAMKLSGRVTVAGYLNEEELYAILNNAKGLIYPSLFEGFGIPIVEAMYMNKLIASSNLTSLPEIGCDSIYYFNPKKPDEILEGIEFLFQSNINDDIEKDYRKQLDKYTVDIMTKEYQNVFNQAVAAGVDYKKSAYVKGVYGDGWSYSIVDFHIVKHKGDIWHMVFRVPEYLKGKIVLKIGKKEEIIKYSYSESNEIIEILKSDNEYIQIRLSSTWNPEVVMNNGDNRELGIMVESMDILTREGREKINI